MTFEQFLKKNMKRISRLEMELDKLFDGTGLYTTIHVEQYMFRPCEKPTFGIKAYTETPQEWYSLDKFPNMTAMIAQIKNDVKEARK